MCYEDLRILGGSLKSRGNVVIHRGHKPGRFKEMTPTTSGVMARFPRLFPIRNPCELRGLCRHSYFGPRTCGGSTTNDIEVSRALNPGFPFSPLNVHFCVQPRTKVLNTD